MILSAENGNNDTDREKPGTVEGKERRREKCPKILYPVWRGSAQVEAERRYYIVRCDPVEESPILALLCQVISVEQPEREHGQESNHRGPRVGVLGS